MRAVKFDNEIARASNTEDFPTPLIPTSAVVRSVKDSGIIYSPRKLTNSMLFTLILIPLQLSIESNSNDERL